MAASKNPECPKCGGFATYRMDLNVRPAVFSCPACWNTFAQSGKSVPGPSRRSIRVAICQRWDQLAADVHHLAKNLVAVEGLGIFDQTQLEDAIFELDNTVRQVMVDNRLRLPESPRRKVPKVTLNELQKLRRVREGQQEKEAEELKQQIRASDHPKQERNQ